MLQKYVALILLLTSGPAMAEQIAGLDRKTYKLNSFSRTFGAQIKESRSGRSEFCGEEITPRVRNEQGTTILRLNAKWASIGEISTRLQIKWRAVGTRFCRQSKVPDRNPG